MFQKEMDGDDVFSDIKTHEPVINRTSDIIGLPTKVVY